MIVIREASLEGAETAAVMRPVTADGMAPTTAMRRFEQAAGPEVEAACRGAGDLPVGSAVVTAAGNLAVRYLIHVSVRSAEHPVSRAGVQQALRNGLRRVREWGVDSVALPPLGTGAGNFDAEESAALMVPILLEYLRTAEPAPRIEIFVESEYERDAFQGELRRHGIEP